MSFTEFIKQPSIYWYCWAVVILSFKMIAVTGYVVYLRRTYKVSKYEYEYGKPVSQLSQRNQELIEKGKPLVQHALGLYNNDMENIYIFFACAFVFALCNPPERLLQTLFAMYVFARFGHSYFYVAMNKPLRATFFGVGLVAQLIILFYTLSCLVAF